MLFYPPGRFFQRGEDRSQGNVEQSTATSMRAPNDLGYAASTVITSYIIHYTKLYETGWWSITRTWRDAPGPS